MQSAARGASDLLLVADAPPTIYTIGQWVPLDDKAMTLRQVAQVLESMLTQGQRETLEKTRDLDFCFVAPTGQAGSHAQRYRVNVHYQRGGLAAAFRAIPAEVPAFGTLNLPANIRDFAGFPNGLVLVTGCTGQGKTTTLAAMVDHMNRTRSAHVITIEDPIEFAFRHGACLIEQRQIGEDSPSFASALRHVLRQRPDVILIGEMRDLETVATALSAAETGHLILTSLHTSSAAQTLARIIDVFPPTQQPQVRTQLAASLRAVVCQNLVRDVTNESLVPATEILIASPAIRRAIRENESHLIYGMIETGRKQGMHTLEQSLADLVKCGRVLAEDALAAAPDPARLAKMIGYTEAAVG
jgi:twitching motility protein PilT